MPDPMQMKLRQKQSNAVAALRWNRRHNY